MSGMLPCMISRVCGAARRMHTDDGGAASTIDLGDRSEAEMKQEARLYLHLNFLSNGSCCFWSHVCLILSNYAKSRFPYTALTKHADFLHGEDFLQKPC